MPLLQATYPIAPKGLATNFEETALPPDYALKFRNRTINAAGGAEKRQGIVKHSDAIPGSLTITSLHELVHPRTGAATLMAGADGRLFRYNTTTSAWTTAYDTNFRGNVFQAVQMVDRLIFVDGTVRPFFTKDAINFFELEAIIEEGTMTGQTSARGFFDSTISANGFWQTLRVSVGDKVRNLTRDKIAAITNVSGSSGVTHTPIVDQAAGDRYRIIDAIELNVIPTAGEADNVATLTLGTSYQTTVVSGVNWQDSGIRAGDWFVNTTRDTISAVTAYSSAAVMVATQDVSGGSSNIVGDSITLYKSAMPIPTRVHVHYGRLYMIDSRDRHLVRISGPDDPTDMTTSQGTLDSLTFSFGSQQPTGDIIKAMASFQRFLVMAGSRYTLLFEGTDPIEDDADTTKDFNPVGLFPQGAKSAQALATIGNDAVIISDDGVQSFALKGDASTLGQSNLSEALKNTLRTLISDTAESEIQVFHYPRRSWVCFKIGSLIYVYNYTPYFGSQISGAPPEQAFQPQPGTGSWSLFDSLFAQQNVYMVRQDGTLLCAGTGGQVYMFDQGTYDDDGTVYTTEYQSGWLTLDEPRRSLQIKQGHYIQPTFHVGAPINYTMRAEAPFVAESQDVIEVSAAGAQAIGSSVIGSWLIGGGSSIFDRKYSLRWRGKEMRLTITTEDNQGPDVMSRFTLYITRHGIR